MPQAKPHSETEASSSLPADAPATQVRWDTSKLQSTYANVCSITSTREEVVLNFGLNQTWERGASEVEIQLTSRIIVSPFAARRMADVLNQVLGEYESRYGKLSGAKP